MKKYEIGMSDLSSHGGKCEGDRYDVTPCSLVARCRHFGGICCRSLHSIRQIRQGFLHIPDDHNLHIPDDHNLHIPDDHNLHIPDDHNLHIPDGHNLHIPDDHNLRVMRT